MITLEANNSTNIVVELGPLLHSLLSSASLVGEVLSEGSLKRLKVIHNPQVSVNSLGQGYHNLVNRAAG